METRRELKSKLPGCYKELWAIHESVDILQKRVVDILEVKASHGAIARRGSLLYAIACDLSQLNHMYRFSIYWFLHFYKNCFKRMTSTLLKTSKTKSPGMLREYEVDKLLNKLTHTFYIQVFPR